MLSKALSDKGAKKHVHLLIPHAIRISTLSEHLLTELSVPLTQDYDTTADEILGDDDIIMEADEDAAPHCPLTRAERPKPFSILPVGLALFFLSVPFIFVCRDTGAFVRTRR